MKTFIRNEESEYLILDMDSSNLNNMEHDLGEKKMNVFRNVYNFFFNNLLSILIHRHNLIEIDLSN